MNKTTMFIHSNLQEHFSGYGTMDHVLTFTWSDRNYHMIMASLLIITS